MNKRNGNSMKKQLVAAFLLLIIFPLTNISLAQDYISKKDLTPENVRTKVFSSKAIIVLSVSALNLSDCQYFFFKQKGDKWVYFNRLDLYEQRKAPDVHFLNKRLFYLNTAEGWGTGVAFYKYRFFIIRENNIESVLDLPSRSWNAGHISFNYEISSTLEFADNVLTIEYQFDISAPESPSTTDLSEGFPPFTAKRKVIFKWDGYNFTLDENKSQLTLEKLEDLGTVVKQFKAIAVAKGK